MGRVEEEVVANWSKCNFQLIPVTFDTIDDILLHQTWQWTYTHDCISVGPMVSE